MRTFRWVGLALALVSCDGSSGMVADDVPPLDGGSTGDARAGVGEPSELMGMTLYHNQVRTAVDLTGSSGGALGSLEWDASLAATAAAYAARCIDADGDGLVDHNPNRSDGHPYYVGENIYASSGKATAKAAVDAWAGEAAMYHYAANTCDRVCGHYTQIVWRGTQKVGCALQNCPGLKYPSTIVCDYGPGGNINNQRPY